MITNFDIYTYFKLSNIDFSNAFDNGDLYYQYIKNTNIAKLKIFNEKDYPYHYFNGDTFYCIICYYLIFSDKDKFKLHVPINVINRMKIFNIEINLINKFGINKNDIRISNYYIQLNNKFLKIVNRDIKNFEDHNAYMDIVPDDEEWFYEY